MRLVVVVLAVVVAVGRAMTVVTKTATETADYKTAKTALVALETSLCSTGGDCVLSKDAREAALLCWAVGPSGVQGKKLVRCPTGTHCVVDRMVSNPFSEKAGSHVVRAGCAAALKEDDLQCGSVACPNTGYLFITECCNENGCNDPQKEHNMQVTKEDCTPQLGLKHGCYSYGGYSACEVTSQCTLPDEQCPSRNTADPTHKHQVPKSAPCNKLSPMTPPAGPLMPETLPTTLTQAVPSVEGEYVQVVGLDAGDSNLRLEGEILKVVARNPSDGQVTVEVKEEDCDEMVSVNINTRNTIHVEKSIAVVEETKANEIERQSVRIQGLVHAAQFNGQMGRIEPGEAEDGFVRVSIAGKVFKLKPENIQQME